MAWGVVQQAQNRVATSSTQNQKAYPSAVTAGNWLIASIAVNLAAGTPSFSDSVNGAWTAIAASRAQSGFNTATTQIFYVQTAAGTPTVTATYATNNQTDMFIFELSGLTSAPFDAANATAQGANLSVTTATADEFVYVHLTDLGAPAVPSGWAQQGTVSGAARAYSKNDPTPAGSVTFTDSAGNTGTISMAAFATTGGPPYVPRRMPLGV